MSNCPECGMKLKQNARFCTACGYKIQDNNSVSAKALCASCGQSYPEGSKFCNHCGNTIEAVSREPRHQQPVVLPPRTESKKSKPGRRFRFAAITLLALLLLIAHVSYFDFFREPEIKKSLLASYELLPNDTVPIVVEYNNEFRINIPAGQLSETDSLKLYSLENVKPHQAGVQIVKAYDIEFQKTKSFSEDVEVNVSLPSEVKKAGMDFFALHHNEKTGEWEELLTFWDEGEEQVSFFSRSFSPVTVSSEERFKGGLNMRIRSMKRPSKLKNIPTIDKSDLILKQYSDLQAPGSSAFRQGMDAVSEAFGLTSTFTGFTEEVAQLPIFSKFNNNAGELGLLFSLYQFSTEIYDGKDQQAKLNLSKNLMSYSLGKWGWHGLRIANIGVFIFDYTLTKFGTAMHQMAEEKWENQYNDFNKTRNQYRKDAAGWKKFMLDNIDKRETFKEIVDAEVNRYLREFSNDPELGLMPVIYEEPLMAKERLRVYEYLNMVIKVVYEEIEKKRQNEIIEKFVALKDLLNSKGQVAVMVYGEEEGSKEVAGLPVKIIVNNDTELWQGITNEAGQFTFDFTWLSYLYYGKPTEVEVIYKGKTLTQQFDMGNSRADVRFYLDKLGNDSEENSGTQSFTMLLNQISGSYQGTYLKAEMLDGEGNIYSEETNNSSGEDANNYKVNIDVDRKGAVKVLISIGHSDESVDAGFKGSGSFVQGPEGNPVAKFPMSVEIKTTPVPEGADEAAVALLEGLTKFGNAILNLYKYNMELEFKDGLLFARMRGTMSYEGQESHILYYYTIERK